MANQGRCQEADARSKSLQPGGRTAHSDVPAGPDGEDGRPRAASSLLVPGEQEDGPRPHPRLGPTASVCPDSNGRGLRSPGLDTSHLAAGQGPHPTPSPSCLPAAHRWRGRTAKLWCPDLCPTRAWGPRPDRKRSLPTGDSSATAPGGPSPHPPGPPASAHPGRPNERGGSVPSRALVSAEA